MRIDVQPRSFLIGAAFVLGGLTAFGFASVQQAGNPTPISAFRIPNRIAGVPAPEDMVTIFEDQPTPYVVPAGRRFVVTGLAVDSRQLEAASGEPGAVPYTPTPVNLEVLFDGQSCLSVHVGGVRNRETGYDPNVVEVPPGLVAMAGTTVSVRELTYLFAELRTDDQDSDGTPEAPVDTSTRGVLLGYEWSPGMGQLVVKGIPTPGQMICVEEGSPITVPAGQVFVATGVGRKERFDTFTGDPGFALDCRFPTSTKVTVEFGGVAVHASVIGPSVYGATDIQDAGCNPDLDDYRAVPAPSVGRIPPGLFAPEGTQVNVAEETWSNFYNSTCGRDEPRLGTESSVTAILLGYLADV